MIPINLLQSWRGHEERACEDAACDEETAPTVGMPDMAGIDQPLQLQVRLLSPLGLAKGVSGRQSI
jgi:hypothetical protein